MTEIETEGEVVEEYAGLVLEDQLLDHLATPKGCRAVWKARLSPELIGDEDDGVKAALEFVISYMDEYREPPSRAVLEEETGYDEFEKPIAPIKYVIGKLKERYQRQQMKRVITTLGRNVGNPEEALRIGLSEFNRIRQETLERGNTMDSSDIGEIIDAYKQRLLTGAIDGVTFGYPELDAHLGGLKDDELTFIIARPKRYKSWQLLFSAFKAVTNESRNVYFATLEMPPEEMMGRYTSMFAGVSWWNWTHNAISRNEIDLMEDARHKVFNMDSRVFFRRPPRGERTVAQIVEDAKDLGAECLYIDQLSFLESTRRANTRWEEVAYICEDLKEATQHFPVYIAAQFNREAANLTEMADLSKIGLSDAIGQTADTILGIYANKDMHAQNLIHLGIIEARSFQPEVWEIQVDMTGKADDYFTVSNVVE